MKNSKSYSVLVIGMCIAVLAGCQKVNIPHGSSHEASKNTQNNVGKNIPTDQDFNELLAAADLEGTVLEFTEHDCKISQTKTETSDGGELAYEADPEKITEDMTVSVQYGENCEVQIATVNQATGESVLDTGAFSDIKKESRLFLYGEFADTHHFTATKIIIMRME